MGFVIEWAALSDTGIRRDHNEDSLLVDDTEGLFIVADGMGGHQSGEKASLTAVESIHAYMVEMRHDPATAARFAQDPNLAIPAQNLVSAIQYGNERILVEAVKDPRSKGMGTTVVGLLAAEDALYLAHVGDSRIYRYRNYLLEQITQDHSLLNHMLNTGQIRPEDAASYGKKNVILRALGLKESVVVDVCVEHPQEGDLYLLCSDGLSDMVPDQMISHVLAEFGNSLTPAVHRLIQVANANGGVDNITVCVLRVYSNEQPTVVM